MLRKEEVVTDILIITGFAESSKIGMSEYLNYLVFNERMIVYEKYKK